MAQHKAETNIEHPSGLGGRMRFYRLGGDAGAKVIPGFPGNDGQIEVIPIRWISENPAGDDGSGDYESVGRSEFVETEAQVNEILDRLTPAE